MSNSVLKKILYVEDHVNLQKVVSVSLVDIGGYELKICGSGDEALSVTEEFNPDLFLLDIMLPDITGPSILRELRKNPKFKDTPAIFISAKFIGHEYTEYRELGALGIIRKPFDPIHLSQIIEMLVTGKDNLSDDVDERTYRVL